MPLVADLVLSFFPPLYLLIYALAHLGWLGAILRPLATALTFLWLVVIAGLIITAIMLASGAGGVVALLAFLTLAAVLIVGVVPLSLLFCAGWVVDSSRARPSLCAACGQETNREDAALCESCTIRGQRIAPRLLYGGRLAGVDVTNDHKTAGSFIVRRKPGLLNYLRVWHVLLDETDIGTLRHGQERRFEVGPGPHEVRVRIGSWSTNSIALTPDEHEVFLECGRDNVEAFWLFFAPTMWRVDRTFRLKRGTRHTNA